MNNNLKLIGYLSEVYNNLDVPNNARKYARLTAVELFKTEFPVKHKPKSSLTMSEINLGLYQGKITCIKAYRNRTGKSLFESKQEVEKYFRENGLTFK